MPGWTAFLVWSCLPSCRSTGGTQSSSPWDTEAWTHLLAAAGAGALMEAQTLLAPSPFQQGKSGKFPASPWDGPWGVEVGQPLALPGLPAPGLSSCSSVELCTDAPMGTESSPDGGFNRISMLSVAEVGKGTRNEGSGVCFRQDGSAQLLPGEGVQPLLCALLAAAFLSLLQVVVALVLGVGCW